MTMNPGDVARYEVNFTADMGATAPMGGQQPAPPQSGGGGGGIPANNKKFQDHLKSISGNTKRSLGATLGIKLGTASILKQSQVFTGYIGTIFQLLGAMVDVILAPFLPILIPAIRKMAELIPYIRIYAQNIFDFLDRTLFEFIRNAIDWLPTGFKDKLIPALAMLLTGAFFLKMTGLWGPFFKLFGAIMRPLWTALSPVLKAVGGFAWKGLSSLVTGFFKLLGTAIKGVLNNAWKSIVQPCLKGIVKGFESRLKFLTAFFKSLFNITVKPILEWTKTFVAKFIKAFMAALWAPFRNLWGRLLARLAPLFRFFQAPFAKMSAWLVRVFPNLTDNFLTRFFSKLAASPVVKGAMAFFSKKGILGMAKAGASAIAKVAGSRAGKLAVKGASMARAAPVIGSIFELGYGGYKAYDDYKKYGAKAAGARLAMTGALTTAGFFDPTGIASAGASIAGHMAMDYGYRKKLDYRQDYLAGRVGQEIDGKIVVQVADKSFELHHRDEITAEVQQQNGGTDKAYVE